MLVHKLQDIRSLRLELVTLQMKIYSRTIEAIRSTPYSVQGVEYYKY